MKLLVVTIFIFLPYMLWAGCRVDGPHTIFANASYEWETTFSYLPQGRDFLENPRIKVSGCDRESSQRKFLMIALGADYFGLSSDTVSVAYNGKLQPDTCRLENSPFEREQTFEMRNKLYYKRTQFFNRCVSVVIRHAGDRNLKNIVSDECQIEIVDGNTAHIKGGYCFFRIYPDSFFELTTKISEQCTDRELLRWFEVDPMEVFGHLNFFVAGDASGVSQDLTPLKSIAVRYNLEPEDRLVPVSESYFDLMPRWPNQWVMPDLHFGNLKIKKVGFNHSLQSNLLVDNRCQKRCLSGLCSSPCDFATPVSGNYTLSQVKGGQKIVMASWYDGGIAPPSWQGVMPGSFHNLGERAFEVGGRYKLEFVMSDPKEDFILLSKQVQAQRLRLPGLRFSEMNIGDEMPDIKTDWGVEAITPIDTIASVSHTNGLYILRDLDLGFGALRDFHYWPPYYEEICDSRLLNCLPPMGKNYLTLGLTFTVNSTEGRYYQLSDFLIERESPLVKSYKKIVSKLPQINCKSL